MIKAKDMEQEMTTLRRELIQRLNKILDDYLKSSQNYLGEKIPTELLESLADSALDLLLPKKPAFNMEQAGVEWQILADAEISQDQIDRNKRESLAIITFESAFSIKGNWNWYPAKPQEEKVWKRFRETITELFSADRDCFTKYVTWAAQPYSRGAMTGLQIKRNPQDFPDAWASFCMSTNYKARKVVPTEERTDLDASGAVISY